MFATGCSFQGQPVSGKATDAGGADAGAPAGWWNPAWPIRVPITITDASTAALGSGYQIGFADSASASACPPVSATDDDLRIVFGTTELARAIDAVTPQPWIWFKLAAPLAAGATSSNEYWVYCGNPSPPPPIGGAAQVFDFYDGFATLDQSVWTVANTPTVSGGGLNCGANNTGIVAKSPTSTVNHAVDFAASAQTPTSAGQTWWGGYQNGTGDVQPWAIWYALMQDTIMPSSDAGMERNGTTVVLDTTFHIYGVESYADHSMMFRHEDAPYQPYAPDPQTMVPPMLDVRLWNNSPSGSITFAWVRTRQAVTPSPSVALGGPEMK